eukprot:Nitzschia sp. Nitz4//scaffold112_size70979//3509//4952//NITZ4_005890-RA/size70979-augustus-gene-0.90-mRNA-1//-1//CDS//3329533229//5073//frame0
MHSYDSISYGSIPSDIQDKHDDEAREIHGSNWIGASFNLTSSIVGAGCIGLGGAIAHSGGLVSIIAIAVFAVLSKYSFDLVVNLAEETSTYEGLGALTYGRTGELTVIISKGVYSFGSAVAYVVIVKDNLSSALSHFFYGHAPVASSSPSMMQSLLGDPTFITIFCCTTVMLPLAMLRDLTPLEKFSTLKITAVLVIVVIVIYLYTQQDPSPPDFTEHWLVVQPTVFESLGTFVFTFVAQHSIHLVYQSLKPSQRKNFSKTTTLGTLLSTFISLLLALFVYITFWEDASSSMFYLYPPSQAVDACRILLCLAILLTYPFPFLTVRELLVLLFRCPASSSADTSDTTSLLVDSEEQDHSNSWLLPGSDRQLKQVYHVSLTIILWLGTVTLALGASSLGSVLNLTGCACGTVISYILPALFSYKLRGHTVLGTILFVLGGSIGLVGTYYSILEFL